MSPEPCVAQTYFAGSHEAVAHYHIPVDGDFIGGKRNPAGIIEPAVRAVEEPTDSSAPNAYLARSAESITH
jgi:hypothetical protein